MHVGHTDDPDAPRPSPHPWHGYPGQVHGDGQPLSDGNANPSLLDRELFVNQADRRLMALAANGQMFFLIDQVAVQVLANAAAQDAGDFAALFATLPTAEPTTPNTPWLSNGALHITPAS